MARCGSGSGLMMAGAIVTVIGLLVAAVEVAAIPRYWMTFVVGVGLLGLGALRWAIRRAGDGEGTARR